MKNIGVQLESKHALDLTGAAGVMIAAIVCAGIAWAVAWRFEWDELRLGITLLACGYPFVIVSAVLFGRWYVGGHVDTLRAGVEAVGRSRPANNIAVVPQFPATPPQIAEPRPAGSEWVEM